MSNSSSVTNELDHPSATAVRSEVIAWDEANDARRLEWLHLLPHGPALLLGGAPQSLRLALNRTHGASLSAHADRKVIDARACESSLRPEALIAVNPDQAVCRTLSSSEYQDILTYRVIPSIDDPRLFIPMVNPDVSTQSLHLLSVYRRSARLKKRLLALIAKYRFSSLPGDTLLLARKRKSALEERLIDIFGNPALIVAISPGALSESRKAAFQVMSRDGAIAGYAKLATTDAAMRAVSQEADVLRQLGDDELLQTRVPTLLGIANIDDALLTVQSPGPAQQASPRFGSHHHAFLRLLATRTGQPGPFMTSGMWQQIQDTQRDLMPHLNEDWGVRIQRAEAQILGTLAGQQTSLSLAHRDFGPWNCRISSVDDLYVFDWETAQYGMVPLYDFFDYHIRSQALSHYRQDYAQLAHALISSAANWGYDETEYPVHAYFQAYLLDRVLSRLRYALWKQELHDELLKQLTGMLEVSFQQTAVTS